MAMKIVVSENYLVKLNVAQIGQW